MPYAARNALVPSFNAIGDSMGRNSGTKWALFKPLSQKPIKPLDSWTTGIVRFAMEIVVCLAIFWTMLHAEVGVR